MMGSRWANLLWSKNFAYAASWILKFTLYSENDLGRSLAEGCSDPITDYPVGLIALYTTKSSDFQPILRIVVFRTIKMPFVDGFHQFWQI
jgi:hypothetical protein